MASIFPSRWTRSCSPAHHQMLAAGTQQATTRMPSRCKGICRYQKSHRDAASLQTPSAAAARPPPGLAPTLPVISEAVERVVVAPVFRTAPWDPTRLQQQEQNPQACILLVSESDVCRSVLAAASLRELLEEAGLAGQVQISTCGTRSYNLGEGPDPAAISAAATLGLTLPADHAARQFNPGADIVSYDLLLVMDKFTAGDVMREVSSFDLVNRQTQFSCKVRRLGEFLQSSSVSNSGPQAASYGSSGDEGEMDIEDPLYGNFGGDEEQAAVLTTGRTLQVATRGLVRFLQDIQEEAQLQAQGAAVAAVPAVPTDSGDVASGSDAHDPDADVSCELPLPGQAPVCTSTASSTSSIDEPDSNSEGDSGLAMSSMSVPLPPISALGPLLRSRVATMGPAQWLAPPMLSRRVDLNA